MKYFLQSTGLWMFTALAFAGHEGSIGNANNKSDWIIGASVGPTWTVVGNAQTISLQPDIEKRYVPYNSNQVFITGELFLAKQTNTELVFNHKEQSITKQLGVLLVGAGNAKISGEVWEDNNPNFNNYDYIYNVNHAYIGAQARLIKADSSWIKPYIGGSIGVAFNRSYDYVETPILSSEVAPPFFTNTTVTSFSYTLNVGVETPITAGLQFAVGYEFSDWGKTQLARAPGQTQMQGPTTANFYNQQLLFALYYTV